MSELKNGIEMTLPQAAQSLGISWHRAYSLALRGIIRAEQRDGRWVVQCEDVERIIRERQAGSGRKWWRSA